MVSVDQADADMVVAERILDQVSQLGQHLVHSKN